MNQQNLRKFFMNLSAFTKILNKLAWQAKKQSDLIVCSEINYYFKIISNFKARFFMI